MKAQRLVNVFIVEKQRFTLDTKKAALFHEFKLAGLLSEAFREHNQDKIESHLHLSVLYSSQSKLNPLIYTTSLSEFPTSQSIREYLVKDYLSYFSSWAQKNTRNM